MAGRAPDELREFELEPGAATLTAQLVQPLHGDRTAFFFVNFYAGAGRALRCWEVQVCLAAALRDVARMDGPFVHDQITRSQRNASCQHAAPTQTYISIRLANVKYHVLPSQFRAAVGGMLTIAIA